MGMNYMNYMRLKWNEWTWNKVKKGMKCMIMDNVYWEMCYNVIVTGQIEKTVPSVSETLCKWHFCKDMLLWNYVLKVLWYDTFWNENVFCERMFYCKPSMASIVSWVMGARTCRPMPSESWGTAWKDKPMTSLRDLGMCLIGVRDRLL